MLLSLSSGRFWSREVPVELAGDVAFGGLLTGLSLVLMGLTPTFALVFVPMFLMGLGTGAFQTLNSAVIVTESQPQYYGRVISLTSMAFGGFMLVSLPVGLAADAFGERVTLIAIGLLIVLAVAILAPMIARTPPAQLAPAAATEPPVATTTDVQRRPTARRR